MGFYIILGVIALIVIISIAIYNSLVKLRLKVKNSSSQIETQLKRRFDLITNLVETVKGYADHEEETLEKVIQARNAFNNANTTEEKLELDNQLSNSLKSIFALSESYPDLKANTNFLKLQDELTETEDKISYSRQFYNDTVEMYNSKIMIFPNNIFAALFGFKEEKFFEITNLEEKEAIKISFDKK